MCVCISASVRMHQLINQNGTYMTPVHVVISKRLTLHIITKKVEIKSVRLNFSQVSLFLSFFPGSFHVSLTNASFLLLCCCRASNQSISGGNPIQSFLSFVYGFLDSPATNIGARDRWRKPQRSGNRRLPIQQRRSLGIPRDERVSK